MADVKSPPPLHRRRRQGDSAGHLGSRIEALQHSYAHPMLVLLGFTYLVHHAYVLLHQSWLWLTGVQAGQALTLAAHSRLALIMHEVVEVRMAWWLLVGAVYGVRPQEAADRALICMAYTVPVFQHLIAINNTQRMPQQKIWGLHLLLMVVGVMAGFRPSHSLVQAICAGTVFTLRVCMHDCYMGHSCNVLTDTFLKSLLYEGAVMHTVGILAWATAYIAVSKHEARKLAAQDDGAVDAQRLQQAAAAFEGGASKGSAGVKHTVSPSCQSPRSVQWSGTRAALNGEPPRSAGASDQGPSAAEADRDKDLVPFETLGINFLRTLGLGPALCWMDERVAKLADRIDETIVLRSACLPVAAYSLTYTHLARVQFMNLDYGHVSYDTLFLWIGAWFMLGRDSVTFDMLKAMHSMQGRLSASLSALSKPRQQTVAELVDSVRQQISGADELGATTRTGADEVQLLEHLGTGSFGKVHKGVWRGTIVAVKSMVLPSNASSRRERMAIMEAAISSALSHPNILQTYSYSLHPMNSGSASSAPSGQQPEQAAGGQAGQQGSAGTQQSNSGQLPCGFEVRLLLEFMDLGTLREALDRNVFFLKLPHQGLDYCNVLDTAADVAKGMLHLHSLNIIHGDLKARNILLKRSATDPRGFTSKISDFGLSHKMEAEETHVSKLFQGTPTHMAPEVLLHGKQSKAADVYAFGITLWEIFTAARPYQDVTPALLAHHVSQQRGRPVFPAGTPQDYVSLAECCWHPDAASRPSFREIVTALTEMQAAVVPSMMPTGSKSNSSNAMVPATNTARPSSLPCDITYEEASALPTALVSAAVADDAAAAPVRGLGLLRKRRARPDQQDAAEGLLQGAGGDDNKQANQSLTVFEQQQQQQQQQQQRQSEELEEQLPEQLQEQHEGQDQLLLSELNPSEVSAIIVCDASIDT